MLGYKIIKEKVYIMLKINHIFYLTLILIIFNFNSLYSNQIECKKSISPLLSLKGVEKLANSGHMHANFELGRRHYVLKDFEEAAKWFRKASNQGLTEAQAILGSMYKERLGVPQSDKMALEWFSKASEQELIQAEAIYLNYILEKEAIFKNYEKEFNLEVSKSPEKPIEN